MPKTQTAQGYRKATIADVAAKAGVSITTVSRFVSGHSQVCSADTAGRIQDAIAALHYTPSSLTPGQSRRALRAVGVCLQRPHGAQHAFIDGVWRGINAAADQRGYLILSYPGEIQNSADHYPFLDGRIDGLILSSSQADPRPERLAAAGMPTVLLTRTRDLPAGCAAVATEEAHVVGAAMAHLAALGHRRIAHLTGPARPRDTARQGEDIARDREAAYRAWMTGQGLAPLVSPPAAAWDDASASEILRAWYSLPEPPTAILCANDALALAALATAREIGWRVPEDLSVVGVDDDRACAESTPRLTTVGVDTEGLGREAFQALIRLMDGADPASERRMLPALPMVVRESTAVCPAAISRAKKI